MRDAIQRGLQALAAENTVVRDAIIVCAAAVIYLLGLSWLVPLARRRATLRMAAAGHVVAPDLLAYATSRALGAVIVDPRPYSVAHTQP